MLVDYMLVDWPQGMNDLAELMDVFRIIDNVIFSLGSVSGTILSALLSQTF